MTEQRDRGAPLDPATVDTCVGALVGALGVGGTHPLNDTQQRIVDAVTRGVFGSTTDWHTIAPRSPEETADALTDAVLRQRLVQLMIVLELVLHPLPEDVEHSVARYARTLDVDEPMIDATRRYAHDQIALMYADIQRSSWYTEETEREITHGRLWELIRSKVAYTGIVSDHAIERKWAALGDLPPGTWGREVFEFYRAHGFPLPGSKHGIVEVSARHDWIHVLAEYPPTPEGEIDVFTFIAAAMDDPRGFTLLVTTLGLFQDYSIRHVALKRVAIARADTLGDPGAPERFADAMHRGLSCNTNVLAIEHFDHADRPLDEVRKEFNVLPKREGGPPDYQSPPPAEPSRQRDHV